MLMCRYLKHTAGPRAGSVKAVLGMGVQRRILPGADQHRLQRLLRRFFIAADQRPCMLKAGFGVMMPVRFLHLASLRSLFIIAGLRMPMSLCLLHLADQFPQVLSIAFFRMGVNVGICIALRGVYMETTLRQLAAKRPIFIKAPSLMGMNHIIGIAADRLPRFTIAHARVCVDAQPFRGTDQFLPGFTRQLHIAFIRMLMLRERAHRRHGNGRERQRANHDGRHGRCQAPSGRAYTITAAAVASVPPQIRFFASSHHFSSSFLQVLSGSVTRAHEHFFTTPYSLTLNCIKANTTTLFSRIFKYT